MKGLIRQLLLLAHKGLFRKHYVEILQMLVPAVIGSEKKSFGRIGDGTYVLPTGLISNDNNSILLSFGISDDMSFEKQFNSEFPNIEIYTFDPTIERLPEEKTKIKFYKMGLAKKDYAGRRLFSLDSIFKKLNLSFDKLYLLKVDIEGWEWGCILDVINKIDVPVICMELHFFPLTTKSETLLLPFKFLKKKNTLKALLGKYYIHHLHANNYQYVNLKKGVFPAYVEVTLIRKDIFYQSIQSDLIKHNVPTMKDKPDIQYPFLNDIKN